MRGFWVFRVCLRAGNLKDLGRSATVQMYYGAVWAM